MFLEFLQWRNIEIPCPSCSGSGVITYGSTSTYMGGIGGQMMTTDVCNKCWGTGDKNKIGVNLKRYSMQERLNKKDGKTHE